MSLLIVKENRVNASTNVHEPCHARFLTIGYDNHTDPNQVPESGSVQLYFSLVKESKY